MKLADHIAGFADYLRGRKLAAWTIHSYRRAVEQLAEIAAEMDALTPAAVMQYQESRSHLSASTVTKDLAAVRSFCRWCVRLGHLDADPTVTIEYPSLPDPSPRALSGDELEIIEMALTEDGTWFVRRNQRAILLMLYAGLRLSECAALDWKDVDFRRSMLTVRWGKRGKGRTIPLHPRLAAALLAVPVAERRGAVAGKRDGSRLAPKSMAHLFERWLTRLGLDVTPHQLRHSFATELLRSGGDILHIRDLMGHANLNTTAIYLRACPERFASTVAKLPESWAAPSAPSA